MKSFKNCFLQVLFTVVVAVGLSLSPVTVRATPILDFNMDAIHPSTARISYAGGKAPLIGKNISVDSVTGINTPLHDGVTIPIVGGILSFTTGAFIGSNSNTWLFDGGGSIKLIGKLKGLTGSGVTLLEGTFEEAQIAQASYSKNFKVAMGEFVDYELKKLTDFYGLSDTQCTGDLNLGFYAPNTPPKGFVSTKVLSGDIANDPPPAVPEPSTMLLLGSGLIGLVGYGRKKLFKK